MNAVPVKDEYKSLKNDKKDDQLELYRDAGNIKWHIQFILIISTVKNELIKYECKSEFILS